LEAASVTQAVTQAVDTASEKITRRIGSITMRQMSMYSCTMIISVVMTSH
jgi:hypothetical protein